MSLLDSGPPTPEPRPWHKRRWIGAAVVLAVHTVLIGFVMTSMPRTIALLPSSREIYYVFHPRPAVRPLPKLIPAPAPPSQVRVPVFRYAPSPPPQAVITAPPGVNGLQLSLFGCAPENLANLTPEQRARCTSSLAMSGFTSTIPGTVKELSLDPGRWRAAITARNTPLEVPCTHLEEVTNGTIGGGHSTAVFVDPQCVIAKATGANK